MGKGNVCVFQKYEDLLYVDRSYIDTVFVKDGDDYTVMTEHDAKAEGLEYDFNDWDEIATIDTLNEFKEQFMTYIESNSGFKRVPRFSKCSNRLYREAELLMENGLYEIALQDNEWSYAILLVRKENEYGDNSLEGLQKKHFDGYFKLLKEALFDQVDELGIYNGAWTSKTLTYQEFKAA